MADGFYLKPATARRLERFLGDVDGGIDGVAKGGGSRLVCHVTIDSVSSGTTYNGTATAYNSTDGSWTTFGTCKVFGPNSEALDIGKRYGAIRYGVDGSGNHVFVTLHPEELIAGSSSGSGGGFDVLTDVFCDSGGVSGHKSHVTATVTIGGKSYPVTFAVTTGGSV